MTTTTTVKYTGCYSRREIEGFIPPKGSALVCIHDPGSSYPKVGRQMQGWDRVTYHRFWDVDQTTTYGQVTYAPASEHDLKWLYEALGKAKGQHCFVSCEAGISRSAAVREYLMRRGWEPYGKEQMNRMVHPNAFILSSLEKYER